ncbi:hypothetical protein UFOVP681_56 [uncultured Caudovirales phage]|uniref:Uncharacterized protein n=1 Tax=uncultured Caudovirales phage TaxID=2100421 RepID=A0A6J5NGS8_9CAUD|nr:hypothetical protein UFOVP681_56 [uncultured Caudovirales phage]
MGDDDMIRRGDAKAAFTCETAYGRGVRAKLSDVPTASSRLVKRAEIQRNRDEAYQVGWDDGYAEGYGKAIPAAHIAALTAERDRFEAALSRACLVGGTTYLVERAETAEAEAAALRERVARLEGALAGIREKDKRVGGWNGDEVYHVDGPFGKTALAALTDGGKDG